MCGDGVWVSKDVRWTIVPREDGQWQVLRSWREIIHQWYTPPGEWHREPHSLHETLEDALCAMGQDYLKGATIPRGIQIKLGPQALDGETALHKAQEHILDNTILDSSHGEHEGKLYKDAYK